MCLVYYRITTDTTQARKKPLFNSVICSSAAHCLSLNGFFLAALLPLDHGSAAAL